MLNPDGVVYGSYRSSLLGIDLNRRYMNPSRVLHPPVYFTKELVRGLQRDRRVALFIDFHGHSRKKNVFMYGCCGGKDEYHSHRTNSLIRMVPYMLSQRSRHFSYRDCRFENRKDKETTSRVVFFKELGVVNSYTVESTFYGCDAGSEENVKPPSFALFAKEPLQRGGGGALERKAPSKARNSSDSLAQSNPRAITALRCLACKREPKLLEEKRQAHLRARPARARQGVDAHSRLDPQLKDPTQALFRKPLTS